MKMNNQKQLLKSIHNLDLEFVQNWINKDGDAGLLMDMSVGKKSLLQLLIDAIEEDADETTYVEMMQLLIKNGADVNYADDVSFSPVFSLIDLEKPHLLELILEHGASLNGINDELETPLLRAAKNGSIQIMTVLLKYADQQLINTAGSYFAKTPLGIAFFKTDMALIELLLKHHADPYAMDNEGEKTIQSIPEDLNKQLRTEIEELIEKYAVK